MAINILVGRAAADGGDDFTNNLATDLAPILVLFGERVVLQYLSRSFGWTDAVALSVGGCGLLAIYVSAIRSGGPANLKAIIGRSRENHAVVEMEVLSSTSSEVCELWNGRSIVRCMGSASITEFICVCRSFADCAKAVPNVMTGSLEDLAIGNHVDKMSMAGADRFRRSRAPSSPNSLDAEQGVPMLVAPTDMVVAKNLCAEAPNLSLNVLSEPSTTEPRSVAVAMIVLQASVLAFSWFATYYIKWKKDDKEVGRNQWPCFLIGTLLVTAGAILSCHIVDSCTTKERYRINSDRDARMLWLQIAQTVNDQSFGSYALFSGQPQHVITTSRRTKISETVVQPVALSDRVVFFVLTWIFRIDVFVLSLVPRRRNTGRQTMRIIKKDTCMHFKCIVAVISFVLGYPLQFIGLRGLHWSTPLAQIVIVFIGILLRSYISRGAAKTLQFVELPIGFELEWYSLTMANLDQAPWVSMEDPNTALGGSSIPLRLEDWGIKTGQGQQYPSLTDKTNGTDTTSNIESDARGIMRIRRQVAKLADWHGTVPREAVILAKAIETVMDALFPLSPDYPDSMVFTLGAYYGASKDVQLIPFGLKRRGDRWTIRADKLEAALSLWLCTAKVIREKDDDVMSIQDRRKDAWLRAKGAAPKATVCLLGRSTPALHRDLAWWLPSGVSGVKSLTEVPASADSEGQVPGQDPGQAPAAPAIMTDPNQEPSRSLEVANHRILGPGSGRFGDELQQSGRTRFNTWDLTLPNHDVDQTNTPGSRDTFLATISNEPLEMAYVREIFSSFMLSVAKRLNAPVGGDAEIVPDEATSQIDAWRNLTLRSTCLDKIARELQETQLGSLQQVYECLVPPLSVEMKLPRPDALIDLAREKAKKHELLCQWKEATEIYTWLLRVAKTYDISSSIAVRAIAVVRDYYRGLHTTVEFKRDQRQIDLRPLGEEEQLQQLRVMVEMDGALKMELDTVDKGLLHQLECLYRWQERPLSPSTVTEDTSINQAFSMVGSTQLHRLAAISRVESEAHELFRELEDGTHDVHSRDVHHWTPLHYSVVQIQGGDIVPVEGLKTIIVRDLIRSGADVNAQDISGWTPLHYACRDIDPWARQMVASLIDSSADLNLRGRDGRVPLHCAAMNGCTYLVQQLVSHGAAIDVVDSLGYTPLYLAVIYGHLDVVKYLWQDANKSFVDYLSRRSILHIMALNGRAEILKHVLDTYGKDKQGDVMERLEGSEMVRNPDCVRGLIHRGDASAETPLFLAVRGGHLEVVRLLLDMGVDLTSTDRVNTPILTVAKENGHDEIVQLLEKKVT